MKKSIRVFRLAAMICAYAWLGGGAFAQSGRSVDVYVCPDDFNVFSKSWNIANVDVIVHSAPARGVRLVVNTPPELAASLDADEVFTSRTIRMKITSKTAEAWSFFDAAVYAFDGPTTLTVAPFTVNVIEGSSSEPPDLADLRDQAINLLSFRHPEYGVSQTWPWSGFNPRPFWAGSSSYYYECGPWEIRCATLVLPPPNNLKTVEVLNYSTGDYWNAKVSSTGSWTEDTPEAQSLCRPLKPAALNPQSGWVAR